jgi:hypothetical protein
VLSLDDRMLGMNSLVGWICNVIPIRSHVRPGRTKPTFVPMDAILMQQGHQSEKVFNRLCRGSNKVGRIAYLVCAFRAASMILRQPDSAFTEATPRC